MMSFIYPKKIKLPSSTQFSMHTPGCTLMHPPFYFYHFQFASMRDLKPSHLKILILSVYKRGK